MRSHNLKLLIKSPNFICTKDCYLPLDNLMYWTVKKGRTRENNGLIHLGNLLNQAEPNRAELSQVEPGQAGSSWILPS